MTADKLLSRLDGVKQTGTDRWIARCPAHDDKRPSLSIKEDSEGRVLVHCFGGCGAADVVSALGLEFRDLFPESMSLQDRRKTYRRPVHAEDALRCVAFESLLVATAASNIANGVPLNESDKERLVAAAAKLSLAAKLGAGYA